VSKTAATFVKVDTEISTASSHYIVSSDFSIKHREIPFSISLLIIGSRDIRVNVVLTYLLCCPFLGVRAEAEGKR
jgi:hypothetical protein